MTRPMVAALMLACTLAAQEPKPAPVPAPMPAQVPVTPVPTAAQRLVALLDELRGLDAKAWQERLQQLDREIAEHERTAEQASNEAKRHEELAKAAAARAKAGRDERKRLLDLRQLLQAGEPLEPKKPPAKTPASEPGKPAAAPPAKEPPAAPAADSQPKAAMAPIVTWAEVEPVFSAHCAGCHDADSKKGGLDLTSFATALQGGGSGRSIVVGQPEQSRLWRMVAQQERPFMPRDADPLAPPVLQKIQQWIEQGAVEDAAAARVFAQQQQASAAKGALTAVEAAAEANAPLPENWPVVAVRSPARAVPLAAIARSPRADLLALPGREQVLFFDAELRPLGVLPCELPRIAAIAFADDGAWLAVAGGAAGRSGKAIIFDVRSGAVIASCGKERDVPLAVAVHRGRGLVALGGSSKRARAFAIPSGREVLAGKHDDFVLGLDFSPDGALLAAGDRGGAIALWETDGGQPARTLRVPRGGVNAVTFHRGGALLASAGTDGALRVWNVADGAERWQKPAHQGEALAVAFGPGDRVASCGSDGRIAVFALDGKPLATSPPCGDWLNGLAFGGSDTVFAGDARGLVQQFALAQKKLTAQPLLPPTPQ